MHSSLTNGFRINLKWLAAIFAIALVITNIKLFNLVSAKTTDRDCRQIIGETFLVANREFQVGQRLVLHDKDIKLQRNWTCKPMQSEQIIKGQLERYVAAKIIPAGTVITPDYLKYSIPDLVEFPKPSVGISNVTLPITNYYKDQKINFKEGKGSLSAAEKNSAISVKEAWTKARELEDQVVVVRGKIALKTGPLQMNDCDSKKQKDELECCHESSGGYWGIYSSEPETVLIKLLAEKPPDPPQYACQGNQCLIECAPFIPGKEYLLKGKLKLAPSTRSEDNGKFIVGLFATQFSAID